MQSGGASSDLDMSPRIATKRTLDGKLICKIVHNKSNLLGHLDSVKQDCQETDLAEQQVKSKSDTEYTVDDESVVKQEYDDDSRLGEAGNDIKQVQQEDGEPDSNPGSTWGPARLSYNTRFTNNLALFKATFPMKLWELVGDPKISMVTWSACGRAILLDTRVFDEKIQDLFPGEFGDNKLRNFCRQLRVYDFNEVNNKDPNWPKFASLLTMAPYIRVNYHHFFRKGHPEDLFKIARVRDIIPRGRSKPKNPRPRPAESLLAPTGPYLIGQPPDVLLERASKLQYDHSQMETVKESQTPTVREVESQRMKEIQRQVCREVQTPSIIIRQSLSQGPREIHTQSQISPTKRSYPYKKANPFASVLQEIGQQAILSSSAVSSSKSCASAGELATFCGSLNLSPLPNKGMGEATSDEGTAMSRRESDILTPKKVTAVPTVVKANQEQVESTNEASSSSLDENFVTTFSELVAEAENTQGHIVRSQKDPDNLIHKLIPQDQKGVSLSGKEQKGKVPSLHGDATHLHRSSAPLTQQLPGENPKPTSSLVLVPCLRTHNTLVPLTYGSRLSAAGIDFLRECPDFKLFLNQLKSPRPSTTDRSQQCSPIPLNDSLDCIDDESADIDMQHSDDYSRTEIDNESDSRVSGGKADNITRENDEVISKDSQAKCYESQLTTATNDSVVSDRFPCIVGKTTIDTSTEGRSTAECIQGGDNKESAGGDSDHSMDTESMSIDWSWNEEMSIKPIIIKPLKEECSK